MRLAWLLVAVTISMNLWAGDYSDWAYSRHSFYVPGTDSGHSRSPDGHFLATIVRVPAANGGELTSIRIANRSHKILATVAIGRGLNTEMLWSPDSKALAVTASDGNVAGPYLLSVVGMEKDKVTVAILSPLVYAAYGRPYACPAPENPNVAAVHWLSDSKRLLVAAQVIPHSVCDNFATFKTFEIDLASQKIVSSFDQLESKKKFGGALGGLLKHAPDECFLNPHSCELAQNKEERKKMLSWK